MPSESEVYALHADQYEALISREDYQHNIPRMLDEIVRVDGLDVIDLGAGTGRLAAMLARRARTMRAFDTSHHMLTITRDKFRQLAPNHALAAVSDHRYLPAKSASADVLLSGWSVSYLAVWNSTYWQNELDNWLQEARRVVRPGGYIILFESLGTGNEVPQGLAHLENVYGWLGKNHFQSKWIRTDYQFESQEEATRLAGFFFGAELAERVEREQLSILPECTGVWWLRM